jgi:hypothetical protein
LATIAGLTPQLLLDSSLTIEVGAPSSQPTLGGLAPTITLDSQSLGTVDPFRLTLTTFGLEPTLVGALDMPVGLPGQTTIAGLSPSILVRSRGWTTVGAGTTATWTEVRRAD